MLKRITVITISIILVLSLFIFPACKKGITVKEFTVRLEGATLCWEAYERAESYSVDCTLEDGSGYEITVRETSYIAPYTKPGEYTFSVSALNKKGQVIARSQRVTYHLGTGEASDVITIGSADDLLAITESTTLTFGEQKVTAPRHYRLTADIDLTGREYTPIGSTKTPFSGILDGAEHTITGLTITKCNADGNIGLFGRADYAVVKNLTLKDAKIALNKDSFTASTKKGDLNCGFLIGDAHYSTVDNCHVSGKIEILTGVITTDTYILAAGGIVGQTTSGRISGTSFKGDVKGQYGKANIGGLVGYSVEGTGDGFLLLNSKADADVNAVATAYNVTSGTSYAYARAGVLIGSISHAGRLASLFAKGSATAATTRDGTSASNITSGVIGRGKSDANAYTVPTYHLYYDSSIPNVCGTPTKLGDYAKYIYPLTKEEIKDKSSYLITEDRYGLDFENYWDLPEDGEPILRGKAMAEQPSLTISLRSEIEDHDFSYDFKIEDVATPTDFDISIGTTLHSIGYNLDNILTKIGTGISLLYSEEEIAEGVSIRLSAEGKEDFVFTTKKSSLGWHLQYGVYSDYEWLPDVFGGYKIINENNPAKVEFYDYTTVDHITITFLSPTKGDE